MFYLCFVIMPSFFFTAVYEINDELMPVCEVYVFAETWVDLQCKGNCSVLSVTIIYVHARGCVRLCSVSVLVRGVPVGVFKSQAGAGRG